MKTATFILFILIFGSIISCQKEPAANPEDPIGKEDSFSGQISPCTKFESFPIGNHSLVDQFTIFNDHFIFGGNNEIMVKSRIDGQPTPVLEEPNLGIVTFYEYDGRLMICTHKGLYELNAQMNLQQITEVPCIDIDSYKSKLIFTSGLGTLSNTKRRPANLLEVDFENNSFNFFTNPTDSNLNAFLNDIEIIGEDIYVLGNSVDDGIVILNFRDSLFHEKYTNQNTAELNNITFPGDVLRSYLFSSRGNLYYYTQNGPSRYLRIKEAGGNFETFFTLEGYQTEITELDRAFIGGFMTNFQVIADTLYWGSSRGLFKFNLEAKELDYTLTQDSRLPHPNITTLYFDSTDKLKYVLTNYNEITRISCN